MDTQTSTEKKDEEQKKKDEEQKKKDEEQKKIHARRRLGLFIGFAALGAFLVLFLIFDLTPWVYPPEEAGTRAITSDANKDVKRDASAVGTVLAEKDRANNCRNSDGTTDWRCWSQQHNPWADHVAEGRLARDEQIAEAQGKLLRPKAAWMPGSQSAWLYTDIPVYSCMHLTATGTITRGVYGVAGPDGINPQSMPERQRQGWLELNGDRATLFDDVPWGAVMGKTCTDAQGVDCGPAFFLGESLYVSPGQVGGGILWVIPNGFVTGQTGAGMLVGIKQLNMSDYNVYQGGYRIDREKAPANKCEQTSLIAKR